jgi:hypothetical protein
MRDTFPESARLEYAKRLMESDVPQRSISLLAEYMRKPEETWRSVWLLYLLKDMQYQPGSDKNAKRMMDQTINTLMTARDIPAVVQLWAKPRMAIDADAVSEELNDLDYESVGRRCYGG